MILIAVGIVVIGGGLYFILRTPQVHAPAQTNQVNHQVVTSTVSNTADWGIYTNPAYGFSFRYPQDFQLVEVSSSSLKLYPLPQPIEFGPYFYIQIIATTTNGLTAAVKNMLGSSLVSYEQKTVNGKEWLYAKANEYQGGIDQNVLMNLYFTHLTTGSIFSIKYPSNQTEYADDLAEIMGSLVSSGETPTSSN